MDKSRLSNYDINRFFFIVSVYVQKTVDSKAKGVDKYTSD